jgi:hypothetical protein
VIPRSRWFVLAVAAIAALGAGWLAFSDSPDETTGEEVVTATGPLSIWPEGPFDAADALRREQTRVDGGADRWRLKAEAVAVHFAQGVFGWITIEVDDPPDVAPEAGPVSYRAREDCGVLCEGDDGWVEVTVDRLLGERAGTVWSVVAVHSDRLRLPVEPGDTVSAGDQLSFDLDVAPDRHAAVGLRFLQRLGGERPLDCGHGFAGEAGVTEAEASTTVPDPLFEDGSCAAAGAVGYVFAYTTARLTVQTGDPMLEPVYVTDLSIVPVRFSQDPPAQSPVPSA